MKLKPEKADVCSPIIVKFFMLHITLILTGCVAYQLPENYHLEKSSNEEIIEKLAVKTHRYTHFLRPHFEKSIKSTGVVRQIVDYSYKPDGEFIADLNDTTGGICFSEPLLNVLTFGIFPHFGCVETGYVFDLHNSKNNKTVNVNSRHISKAVAGWIALFYLPFDNWVASKELYNFESRRLGIELSKAVHELNSPSYNKNFE